MERWHSYKRWIINKTKPSQPPVYRNITGKTTDIMVLNCLDNLFKRYAHVLENDLFQEFATLDTIPNIVNPKCIIQEMVQKYFSNVIRVYMEPNFSETFIFTFYTGAEDYKHEFVFSNCMKFNEDVNIICFLFHISLLNVIPNHYFGRCETVQILTRLMRNKYGIDVHDTFPPNPIENKLTVSVIANCFPSITWDIFHNNYNDPVISKIVIDYSVLFPDFDLPKTIFLPLIVMVLPKLEEPPIAILIAIFIKIRDFYMPAEKYPLELIYNRILEIFNYSIVPECLKLNLCMKWNITVKKNNIYKFAPCFAKNRLKAKHLILKIKSNDPKLNDILLKI